MECWTTATAGIASIEAPTIALRRPAQSSNWSIWLILYLQWIWWPDRDQGKRPHRPWRSLIKIKKWTEAGSLSPLAVRHDGTVELGALEERVSEDGVGQVGALEIGAAQIGRVEVGAIKINAGELRVP